MTLRGWLFTCIGASLLASAGAAQADPAGTIDAETSKAQMLMVEQALSAGRITQAEAMLGWLRPRLADDYDTRFNLALAEYHLTRGNVAAAQTALSAVDKEKADLCRFFGISGWIAFRARDWNRAIDDLATSIDACPGDPGRWNLLGQALARKGEYTASIEAYDAAIALEWHPAILNNRGLALAYSGALEAAIGDFGQATALAPANAEIAENLAFVRALAGMAFVKPASMLEAHSLASAGDGAVAARQNATATSYYARAVLAYDRFDAGLWQRALGSGQREEAND
ncbi:MAG: tetratricopeptide repeat protein [Sphingorhabdus sp.]